ncbi:MAG: hypothetical protein QCI38_05705 [Candidatus Thermoplasmatota archaeon]|nr:hypothetical protein [Candidatus Thermoplasmatota archaeon]
MRKSIAFAALLILLGFLALAAYNMREFGDPVNRDMDQYFLDNAQEETGANNVVTSIVFDYRGYDTLGEATVLFAAVSGVMISIRYAWEKKGKNKPEGGGAE